MRGYGILKLKEATNFDSRFDNNFKFSSGTKFRNPFFKFFLNYVTLSAQKGIVVKSGIKIDSLYKFKDSILHTLISDLWFTNVRAVAAMLLTLVKPKDTTR